MSLTPPGGNFQGAQNGPNPRLPGNSLLILALGGASIMATIPNPAVGVAIGVGAAVVGLLHTITK